MDERIYKKYYIGQSKPGNWVSVYVYKPHSHEIRVKRGEIFAVISLIGPETFAVSTAGNLILDNLHEAYFENKSDTALISLEKAVKGASSYLQKLLENDKAADIGIDLNLTAITLLGDIVYFVSMGTNCMKIWRDGEATDITTLLKDPTGEGLVRVGSMVAKEGDVFFLTTHQFDKEVHEDELKKLAETFSDIPLKQIVFNDESKIAMLMLGYNIDFEALKKPKVLPIKEQKKVIKEVVEEDENLEEEELDVIVDETPKENLPEDTGEYEDKYLNDDNDFLSKEVSDEGEDEKDENIDMPIIPPVVVKPKRSINFTNPLPKIGSFLSSVIKKPKEETFKYTDDEEEPIKERKFHSVEIEKEELEEQGETDDKVNDVFETQREEVEEEREEKEEQVSPQARIVNNSINEKPTIIYYLSKIGEKIKGFGRLVWEDWLGMGKNSTYLRGANKNRRWGFLLVVLVVVGGMIYFSVQDALNAQNLKSQELDAMRYINEASTALDGIKSDVETIAKATINIERKNIYLTQLDDIEEGLNNAENVASVAESYQEQADRLQLFRDLINKTIAVTNPTLVIDMGAKNPGSTISDLAIGNKLLYFVDEKYGKIYSIGYDGKNDLEIATGLTAPYSLTYDTLNGSLLFMDDSTDRKLGIINLTDKTIQRIAGTSESKMGGVTQIEFAVINSGAKTVRVFAIDPTNQSVYALESSGGEGYGLPVRRGINLEELSGVKDIAIADLKIYLLLPFDQGIYRALSDRDDTPDILGLEESVDDLTKATAFYIDDVYLYIADPTTKTIYVLTKGDQLTLKAKYTYRGTDNYFANIKEVVVDRASGTIFVLDGSRIFSLSTSDLANF